MAKKYPKNWDRISEVAQNEIWKTIGRWAKNRTKKEIDDEARKYQFGAGPLMDIRDCCTNQHYLERETIQWVEDQWYGKMQLQRACPFFSKTPGRIKWAAKPMGTDTDYILHKYVGLTQRELDKLKEKHIIGKPGGAEGPKTSW